MYLSCCFLLKLLKIYIHLFQIINLCHNWFNQFLYSEIQPVIKEIQPFVQKGIHRGINHVITESHNNFQSIIKSKDEEIKNLKNELENNNKIIEEQRKTIYNMNNKLNQKKGSFKW